MADETLCRECRRAIPKDARICTECSSYQDWRRWLFRWSGLLTAALAMVPLWTGAYSLWTLAVPDPAEVKIAIGGCKADQVLVRASNTGGEPALLGSPSVEYFLDGRWARFSMDFPMDEDDFLLEPNEIDIIALRPIQGGTFSEQDDGGCVLRATFSVTSSEDERDVAGATCTCRA